MSVGRYLRTLCRREEELVDACEALANQHDETAFTFIGLLSQQRTYSLRALLDRYTVENGQTSPEPNKPLFHGPRTGGLALLYDLHELWLLATEIQLSYKLLSGVARSLRDGDLQNVSKWFAKGVDEQFLHLRALIKRAARESLTAGRRKRE